MTEDDEQSEKIRGRPFPKGASGNPAGRPRGSRNRFNLQLEELAFGKAEEIISKITSQAISGDQVAQRLYFERILPKNLERPVDFEIPPLHSAADADDAMQAVIGAVTSADLTPGECEKIRALIEFRLKTLEAKDWELRLQNIEKWVASES